MSFVLVIAELPANLPWQAIYSYISAWYRPSEAVVSDLSLILSLFSSILWQKKAFLAFLSIIPGELVHFILQVHLFLHKIWVLNCLNCLFYNGPECFLFGGRFSKTFLDQIPVPSASCP